MNMHLDPYDISHCETCGEPFREGDDVCFTADALFVHAGRCDDPPIPVAAAPERDDEH